MLVVVVLDCWWSWRLPCRKTPTPCRWFPRKVASVASLPLQSSQYLRCRHSMRSRSPARCRPAVQLERLSVGFQPAKNLLLIVRISCPRFWFWTDILRPLVSFPSPLREVCLCPVVFLSSLVLYPADVLVHSLIPKDALLFVRCRTDIYRFQVHLC